MMEARLLHFKHNDSRWSLFTTRLPDIPLFSFEGGQTIQRLTSLYHLPLNRLEYEVIFSEFLDVLNYIMMEETVRGW